MKRLILVLFSAIILTSVKVHAWTEWNPHVPYDVKGKSAEQVYELAQMFKADYRRFDNEEVVTKDSYYGCIHVYVNGVEKFMDFVVAGKFEKYERYLENSLRNFNAAASLLECAGECSFKKSGLAWLELGDLYMSRPTKFKLNDYYNKALSAYANAGDRGAERGYEECAKIWLIPDGGSEDQRNTMACRFYRKAMGVCLKQGRKTDALIYVDKVRNLGYRSLSEGLLDEIKQYKSSNQ